MQNLIQAAADHIQSASRILALTGAGVSKESGVPTFRDVLEGMWAEYDPAELATPEGFRANPGLVWNWYQQRRAMSHTAAPNPGHYALAALERRETPFLLVTQNVDDLHERAGSTEVVHLHGTLAGNRCFDDCQGHPTRIRLFDTPEPGNGPPHCPHCGAWVRPDVVWFGEALPDDAMAEAYVWAVQCDVMLVVGTSGMVVPAALLPGHAKANGATIIEINPDSTPISDIADIRLAGPSGEMLPMLLEALQ